jgi:hypothetical protein
MPHPAGARQGDDGVWLGIELAAGEAGRPAACFNPAEAWAVAGPATSIGWVSGGENLHHAAIPNTPMS